MYVNCSYTMRYILPNFIILINPTTLTIDD